MGCIDGNNVEEEYGWRKSQFKKLKDDLIPCGGVEGTLCYICKRSKSTRKGISFLSVLFKLTKIFSYLIKFFIRVSDVCNDQHREMNFTQWKIDMESRTSTTVVTPIPTSTTKAPTSDLVPATSTASTSISTLETDAASSMASSVKPDESSPAESEGPPEEGADPVGGTAGKLKSGDTEKTKSDKSSAKTSNIISATIFAHFFALTLF